MAPKKKKDKRLYFLGPVLPQPAIEKSRFLVLPVPYERTTTFGKGTAKGPGAILDASYQIETLDEELWQETDRAGIHTLPAFGSNEKPEKFIPKLENHVEKLLAHEKFLVSLGGEHSITAGLVPPFARRWKNLSIFHIDAHADLRESYNGSRYSHASAAARFSEHAPVVQYGIRNVSPDEFPRVNTGNVMTFMAHDLRKMPDRVERVLKNLTDDVYVTIDIDGFDPSCVPGTGTPQPGGLDWYDGLEVLKPVCEKKNVVGLDIMEVMPLPHEQVSEFFAAKLAYRLMGYIARKNGWVKSLS